MKKTWTTAPNEIDREISSIIARELPLTFCQHGGKASKVLIRGYSTGLRRELLLERSQRFDILDGPAILFYQAPQKSLKGFEVNILETDQGQLSTNYPDEIFEVERRRLSRIKALSNSMVSFIVDGSTRLDSCKVCDISQEGAQLIGRSHLKSAMKLAPLTFTLGMRYSNFEEIIIVSEATVVRIKEKGDGAIEYGIHFHAADAEQEKLEHYIMLRNREDTDLNPA